MVATQAGIKYIETLQYLATGAKLLLGKGRGGRRSYVGGKSLMVQANVVNLLIDDGLAKVTDWVGRTHLNQEALEIGVTPAGRKAARQVARTA